MLVYKLTDSKMQTCMGCQWELNEPREILPEKRTPKEPWGRFHWYEDSLLAVLHDPNHGQYLNTYDLIRNCSKPRGKLFEAEAEGDIFKEGSCGGSTKLTLLKEISLPGVTPEQRIKYAVLCVQEAYPKSEWVPWADKWLSGEDRTESSVNLVYDSTDRLIQSFAWRAPVTSEALAWQWLARAMNKLEGALQDTLLEIWLGDAVTAAVDWALIGKPLDLITIAKKAVSQ